MSQPNPLQRYFRQPKLYVTLPSKGLFYEPGAFQGDYNQVPVFAMTGMDELIMKTPDALYSGEATAKVIESCCPYIKNAGLMPSIDIDALMVAIRIATFGETMDISHTCKNCGTENSYDINLTNFMEYFNNLKFVNSIDAGNGMSIKIRPLQYNEMSYFSIENYKLQKTLFQINELKDEEKQTQIDAIYKNLSELQLQLFLTVIESVSTPDGTVTEKAHIEDWLRNTERTHYALIKEKLESNKETWSVPSQPIVCSNCQHKDELSVTLDQSNFFG
jgi:hypothetical protein